MYYCVKRWKNMFQVQEQRNSHVLLTPWKKESEFEAGIFSNAMLLLLLQSHVCPPGVCKMCIETFKQLWCR